MRSQSILVNGLAILVLVGATACGSAASSPSQTASSSGSADAAAARAPSSQGASPTPTNAPPAEPASWHGFRGDASHAGIATSGPVGHPVVNWQYHAKAAVRHAIAIVGDQVSFASDDGTVYALDRSTGKERWTVNLGTAPLIGPWADDGRLYLLNGAGAALALDAASGKTLWTSKAYGGATEPVVDRGVLYFGTGDGRVIAIDGATGAEAWAIRPSPGTAWVGNPAISDGRLYVGTSDGYVAIDLTTRKAAWVGDTDGDQTGSAAVSAGVAFIAAGGDSTTTPARAFDAATGDLRWTAGQLGLTFPLASDGTAFSSTMTGVVQALDLETGAVRWSVQLGGKIRPMAVAGRTLYVPADTERRIYAIDTTTGGELWQFDVDDSNDCCIAVAGGAVYAATLAGTVYSIGGDGASIAPTPFGAGTTGGPSESPAPSATAAAIPAIQVRVDWTADLRSMKFEPICQIAIDPRTGNIWAPEAVGDTIAIFDPHGKLLEQWGQPGDRPGQFNFMGANGGYGTLAFARDGSFFVLDIGNRRIQHFSAKRKLLNVWGGFGSEPGQFRNPVGIAVALDGTVWVLDDQRGVVEHFTAAGKVLGSFDPFQQTPVNDGANNLARDAKDGLYVSAVDPTHVSVFEPSGNLTRFVGDGAFTEQATDIAVDAKGRLFVTQGPERGDRPGVLVFAADGSVIGGFGPLGDGDGELVFPAGIALDGKGGVYVEDSLPDSARLMRFELPASLR